MPLTTRTGSLKRAGALGLARVILGPGAAQWFYEGMTQGCWTLDVWYEAEKLTVTLQTNSQPAPKRQKGGHGKVGAAVEAVHEVVKR